MYIKSKRHSRDYRTGLVHNFMKRVGQSSSLMLLIILFPNFGS